MHGGAQFDALDANLQHLRTIDGTKKPSAQDQGAVIRVLTIANEVRENLTEGLGTVNSKLQGHFDPKVQVTPAGIDLTEQAKEAVLPAAHHIQPLLVDKTGHYIYASTYGTDGKIPISQITGLLKEMIDGNHYVKSKK